MSRTKSNEIPHYEMLYIIPNRFTEDEVGPICEKVEKMIESQSGKITYKEEWGKKKLAYKIKDSAFGYYYLVEFDLPGAELENVDKALRMDREILRYQIVSKKIKTAEEIQEEKKRSEYRIKDEEKKEEKAIEQEKEKEKSKSKMDLKDLDEKLDRILDTNDLL